MMQFDDQKREGIALIMIAIGILLILIAVGGKRDDDDDSY